MTQGGEDGCGQCVRTGGAESVATSLNLRWFFETYLPRTIEQSAVAKIEAMTAVIRFEIVGEQSGVWDCRFDRGTLVQVVYGKTDDAADFGFRIDSAAFAEIVSGRSEIQPHFFDGAIEMSGDVRRALMMVPIMGSFFRDFPVKADRV